MERARRYHAKLTNIKKEMSSLHEKTAQLKVAPHSLTFDLLLATSQLITHC